MEDNFISEIEKSLPGHTVALITEKWEKADDGICKNVSMASFLNGAISFEIREGVLSELHFLGEVFICKYAEVTFNE